MNPHTIRTKARQAGASLALAAHFASQGRDLDAEILEAKQREVDRRELEKSMTDKVHDDLIGYQEAEARHDSMLAITAERNRRMGVSSVLTIDTLEDLHRTQKVGEYVCVNGVDYVVKANNQVQRLDEYEAQKAKAWESIKAAPGKRYSRQARHGERMASQKAKAKRRAKRRAGR